MADGGKEVFTWQVGPAAILGILQIVALVGGGFLFFAKQQTQLDTATENAKKLSEVVDRTKDIQTRQSERLTKVETVQQFMVESVHRIEAALTGAAPTAAATRSPDPPNLLRPLRQP